MFRVFYFLSLYLAGFLPLAHALPPKFDELLKEVPSSHFYSIVNMQKLLDKYTEEELECIYKDFVEIRQQTFIGVTKQRDYLVTAGAPTSGKSTILEGIMEGKNCLELGDRQITRAYIDPDRSCLFKMEHTYRHDLATGRRDPQKAYEHWREASNFLSNVYLAIALKEGYAIAHGSTMATPFAKNALKAIQNLYGYKIAMIHVTCDEEIRKESERQRRARGVVQCTDADFYDKQRLFFTLLEDYIASAPTIFFCYRSDMSTISWAAKIDQGRLFTYDAASFHKIWEAHDAANGVGFSEKIFSEKE